MNVIIDGIEYQPVEQKVDQEREDAMVDMVNDIGWHDNTPVLGVCTDLYDAGYRKVGEAVTVEDLMQLPRDSMSLISYDIADNLLKHFDITKKVVK